MLNKQESGATPRKRLRLRRNCNLTLEDVRELENSLAESRADLILWADDENVFTLRMAGRIMEQVANDLLYYLTDEEEKGGEA